MSQYKKLNLGCGDKLMKEYINVDKFETFNPDLIHDLEIFPYPFEDETINEIQMIHVLEHIGQQPDVFINIMKELYRICVNEAEIHIRVPHPRHDDYLSDPTHVRPITTLTLALFDLEENKRWQASGAANSRMAMIHSVNFKIMKIDVKIDKKYQKQFNSGEISIGDIEEYASKYNNVIKETYYLLKVIK